MENIKPSRGQAPIALNVTPHRLTLADDLLTCSSCSAQFRPQPGSNFAWPVSEGAGAECSPEPTEQDYRALSVQQPWAGMQQRGEKPFEIRTWGTSYRGDLLIITGLKPANLSWLHPAWPAHKAPAHPLGVAMCLVELWDCRPMRPEDARDAGCPYEPGLMAWCLRNVRPVQPLPVKGAQGLMKVRLKLEPLTLPA